MKTMLEDVAVDAYSAEDDAEYRGRIARLNRVLGYIYAENGSLEDIKGIHDHKGSLTVVWKKEPNASSREKFYRAWEECNELRENVTHILYVPEKIVRA